MRTIGMQMPYDPKKRLEWTSCERPLEGRSSLPFPYIRRPERIVSGSNAMDNTGHRSTILFIRTLKHGNPVAQPSPRSCHKHHLKVSLNPMAVRLLRSENFFFQKGGQRVLSRVLDTFLLVGIMLQSDKHTSYAILPPPPLIHRIHENPSTSLDSGHKYIPSNISTNIYGASVPIVGPP